MDFLGENSWWEETPFKGDNHMGLIRIEIEGSFRPRATAEFSATKHGHAQCIAEAIAWLSSQQLPYAISHDHDLHAEGEMPSGTFRTPILDDDPPEVDEGE